MNGGKMMQNKSTGAFVFSLILAYIIAIGMLVLAFIGAVNGGAYVYEHFGVGGLTYSTVLLAAALGMGVNVEKTRKK